MIVGNTTPTAGLKPCPFCGGSAILRTDGLGFKVSEYIICPWCGNEHDPCGSHDDDIGQWQCAKCLKEFIVDIDYSPNYTTKKET